MSELLVFRTHMQHALCTVPTLPISDIPAALLLLESSLSQLRLALHTHALPKATSIQTLPSELLLLILSQSCPPSPPAYYRRLLKLSTVSRHWRSHILSTPSLWTCLTSFSFSSFIRTKTLLSLSSTSLLSTSIDLRSRSSDIPAAASLALAHLARTRDLNIVSPPNALSILFGPLPQLHALPNLETLNLSNHSVTPAPLPIAHLTCHSLSELILSDFHTSFTSPLFLSLRRLTTLDLSRSFVRSDDTPDLPALLNVLRNSEGLEVLVLRNVLPQTPSEDEDAVKTDQSKNTGCIGMETNADARVHLPSLQHLELEDLQQPLGALLSNLVVPKGCKYSVHALACPGNDESFDALLPCLVERATGLDVENVDIALDGRALRVRLFDSSISAESKPETEIKLIWRGIDESRPSRLIRDVISQLDMHDASDLVLSDVEMDELAWSALLKALPGVRRLRAEAGALGGLFDALGSYAAAAANDDSVVARKTQLLAPSLWSLTLARASFTDGAVLRSFVSFVRQWRDARAAALASQGSLSSVEPVWSVAGAAGLKSGQEEKEAEERTWHRDLEAIDLDRCGFVSEEQIEALKEAGMVLAGF